MSMQQTISPVDGSVYAERPFADAARIDAVFAKAVAAQHAWAARPLEDRAALGQKFCEALLRHSDAIALDLAWSMGRPISQAPGEVRGCVERARFMIEAAAEGLAPLDPGPKPGFKRYVKRVPLGVVFVIAPWNYATTLAYGAYVLHALGDRIVLTAGSHQYVKRYRGWLAQRPIVVVSDDPDTWYGFHVHELDDGSPHLYALR